MDLPRNHIAKSMRAAEIINLRKTPNTRRSGKIRYPITENIKTATKNTRPTKNAFMSPP